jgi:hypothetical protein
VTFDGNAFRTDDRGVSWKRLDGFILLPGAGTTLFKKIFTDVFCGGLSHCSHFSHNILI